MHSVTTSSRSRCLWMRSSSWRLISKTTRYEFQRLFDCTSIFYTSLPVSQMSELYSLSVREMREGLLGRRFSAVELTEDHLKRIHSTNTELNSFITVCDQAREEAKRADERLSRDG